MPSDGKSSSSPDLYAPLPGSSHPPLIVLLEQYGAYSADLDFSFVESELKRLPEPFDIDSPFYYYVALHELKLFKSVPSLTKEMRLNIHCQQVSRYTVSAVKKKLLSQLTSDMDVQAANFYPELLDAIGRYLEVSMTSDLCLGHMNPHNVHPKDNKLFIQPLNHISASLARFYSPEHHLLAMTYTYLNQYGCYKLLKQQERLQRELARQICAFALHRSPTASLTLPPRADVSGEVSKEFCDLLEQFLFPIKCPPTHRLNRASTKNRNGKKAAVQVRPAPAQ